MSIAIQAALKTLREKGVDPTIILDVIEAIGAAEAVESSAPSAEFRGQNADISAEKRREKDRERKRIARLSAENLRNSAESAECPQDAPTPDKETSPTPPKEINPYPLISPQLSNKLDNSPLLNLEAENPPIAKPKKKIKTKIEYSEKFEMLWAGYLTDPNMSKAKAFEAFERFSEVDQERAIASCPGFRRYCATNEWYRPLHLVRYLTERRFDQHCPQDATANGTSPVQSTSPIYRPLLSRYRDEKGHDPPGNSIASYFPTAWVMAATTAMRELQ